MNEKTKSLPKGAQGPVKKNQAYLRFIGESSEEVRERQALLEENVKSLSTEAFPQRSMNVNITLVCNSNFWIPVYIKKHQL